VKGKAVPRQQVCQRSPKNISRCVLAPRALQKNGILCAPLLQIELFVRDKSASGQVAANNACHQHCHVTLRVSQERRLLRCAAGAEGTIGIADNGHRKPSRLPAPCLFQIGRVVRSSDTPTRQTAAQAALQTRQRCEAPSPPWHQAHGKLDAPKVLDSRCRLYVPLPRAQPSAAPHAHVALQHMAGAQSFDAADEPARVVEEKPFLYLGSGEFLLPAQATNETHRTPQALLHDSFSWSCAQTQT